jgi:hypothetical protein
MSADEDSHRLRVPEPLEALIEQLQRLRVAFGDDGAAIIAAADADLRQAAAARDSGHHQEAMGFISRGMARLAALAEGVDPEAGRLMRYLIGRFRVALEHGQADDARQAADVMREMSGAEIIEPGEATRGGGGKIRR